MTKSVLRKQKIHIEIVGDMDEVVDTTPLVRVRFSYPLTKPVVAELTNPGPWTRGQLIRAISEQYQAIYAEEAETSKVAVGRASARLLNRNRTTGVHGIWGHDLSDLILCGFHKGDDGIYELDVES